MSNNTKEFIIQRIVDELRKIPLNYLKNLLEIVLTFRKNLPISFEDRKVWQEIEEETRERRKLNHTRRETFDSLW
ncbi:MAG: hypothetical protein NW226_13030 [Microscillaceae bacterium]|nr:hypothetical protein [Microscillaceae bacterium]